MHTIKLRSAAFRRGLCEGFASPLFFFAPRRYYRVETIDSSLNSVWSDVDRALAEAMEGEGIRVGKTAGKAAGQERLVAAE